MEPLPDYRRQIDAIFERQLEAMQQSINTQIAESRDARGQCTEAINRILALQERFLEHDRRETEDRKAIIATLEQVSATLVSHSEAIASLKTWSKGLTGVVWAAITGVTGWIISHLSAGRSG